MYSPRLDGNSTFFSVAETKKPRCYKMEDASADRNVNEYKSRLNLMLDCSC